MSKIKIVNMMFYGFHGIYEYEREQGQKFYLDVEMETRDQRAAESDKMEDGIDTAVVYGQVKDVVENKRFELLQALASHIGNRLLEAYPSLGSVTTRVRKPSVPISGPLDYVEVEVTCRAK